MGSLMAGWNSPFKDEKSVMYQRNKSLTRGEIDAYWKSKKKTEEEHLKEVSGSQYKSLEKSNKESGGRIQRSSSLPQVDKRERSLNYGAKPDGEKFNKSNSCWWTRSNWAFLNEPPVVAMEGLLTSHKYVSQYNATEMGNAKAVNKSPLSI
ncbi:hypothetical protein J5N97_007428 [Dioscorea zingiberensis]|uniref:Uncharacterized protein n=1 Tax=Dioscorea zingiberensis TaxID=325984 RepID=A0A9D5HVG5_9LILI|nr:hypothetical protein J5N97_007428 [Dioscorea zingiberensis]